MPYIYPTPPSSIHLPFPVQTVPPGCMIARRSSTTPSPFFFDSGEVTTPRALSSTIAPSPRPCALPNDPYVFLAQPIRRSPELTGVGRSRLDAPPQDTSSVDAKDTNALPVPRHVPSSSSPSPCATGNSIPVNPVPQHHRICHCRPNPGEHVVSPFILCEPVFSTRQLVA